MAQDSKERIKTTKKWVEWLKADCLGQRLAIGFVIMLALAVFLHFREVRIDTLEVGTSAKHYVVAQVDFEFPDEESTLIVRQEALKDLGYIYQLYDKEIKEKRFDFENVLIHHNDWRKKLANSTYEEMNKAADQLEDFMFSARFADARTIKKMEELKLDISEYYTLDTSHTKKIVLPASFWRGAFSKLKKSYPEESVDYIVSYFQKFHWSLVNDPILQKKLRDIIGESIPQKLRKIRSGSRIIDQGEKVEAKHVAMQQAMKEAISLSRNIWQPLTIIGSLLFALLITILGAYYFKYNHKSVLTSVKKLALYATIVVLTLLLAKVTEYVLVHNPSEFTDLVRYPLFVPFAAILMTVLLGSEIALFTSCFFAVLLGVSLAVDHSRFLIMNLILGVVAILFSQSLRKRKEVFSVSAKVWLAGIPILFSYSLISNTFLSYGFVADLVTTFCFMMLTAILVIGFLPILESIYHIMTDITLMEYMDPNNELLRRLSLEAPGTYQHSMVVGTLAEAAAQAIGANGLFCRVSTQYHDIGKLFNPHYFTENQMGGFNIHQLLTPMESSQVIIAHVPEGVALAKKHALPQSFVDVIQQHHGTTLVYYFYCKQVEQMGGDVDAVDEEKFRYPGPKPKSKESAIIMIADTVEAASRSMDEVSEESLIDLVERLVADKMEEGQFDESQLTFEELGVVKKTIIKTLGVTRHLRVKYPEKR